MTLGQPLWMGIDLPNFFQLCVAIDKEAVLHLDNLFPYNIGMVFSDQVIDIRNAARGRIFNGKDPVVDGTVHDGDNNILKVREGLFS